MLIHSHERQEYVEPTYAPANGQIYGPDYDRVSEGHRRQHEHTVALRKAMAYLLYGKPKTKVKAPEKTPYTNSYVRSFDGALMVEIGGHGFVSETWAVRSGLLHDRRTTEAREARTAAREVRKSRHKTKAAKRISI